MENKKMKLMTIVDRVKKDNESAFLVMSDKQVGVTNELGDIVYFIKSCQKDNVPMHIVPGKKHELLQLQHRVLFLDEISNSIGADRIVNPKCQNEYNLIDRTEPRSNFLSYLGKGRV